LKKTLDTDQARSLVFVEHIKELEGALSVKEDLIERQKKRNQTPLFYF
jgi:hypothetical protein